jgi:N-acetylglucosamine-6-sulfatase
MMNNTILLFLISTCLLLSGCKNSDPENQMERPNVVFFLVDDQRYDFLSFLDHPWIKTPHIDALAENAVYFNNAFVTTSICSPSRASILTGTFAHYHEVVDNDTPLNRELPTFPKEMQKHGYKTALIGKWHMGVASGEPRPGFDYWLSFPGQGKYYDPELNINGKTVKETGYMTDILTDYSIRFMEEQIKNNQPFCLYLSHKAVHEKFEMAERHKGIYKDLIIPRPSTFENNDENNKGKPAWVVKQRKSQHGAERESWGDFDQQFRNYSECMLGVDESVGKVAEFLNDKGILDNTIFIYFSDNGYFIGEHGLIDKRVMYEEGIRVPLFIHYPERFREPQRKEQFVLNIDIAPTILDLTGIEIPSNMHGKSVVPIIDDNNHPWRQEFLYEYFIDKNTVQTPTIFGLRTEKYSYITTYGVWDNYELYDMEKDPEQKNNLLADIRYGHNYGTFLNQVQRQKPELYRNVILPLDQKIDSILAATGGRRTPSYKLKQ